DLIIEIRDERIRRENRCKHATREAINAVDHPARKCCEHNQDDKWNKEESELKRARKGHVHRMHAKLEKEPVPRERAEHNDGKELASRVPGGVAGNVRLAANFEHVVDKSKECSENKNPDRDQCLRATKEI